MQKKLLFIVNSNSGTGRIRDSLVDVLEVFAKAGYAVEIYLTGGPGDATKRILEGVDGFDLVVCSGGDGTVNEVASGLALLPCESRPPLGIIPAGTTNDYCHTLGIPTDEVKAAEIAVSGEPFICDTGLLADRRFVYTAAFGIFTDVPYSTPQDQKLLWGGAAYVFEAIRNLTSYHPYNISIAHDSGVLTGEYFVCLISNTVSMAGVRKAFNNVAKLDDGLLELTLIKEPKSLADVQQIINILLAIDHIENSDFIDFVTTTRARITASEDISWTVDGENAGRFRQVEAVVSPKSLTVLTGPDFTD